MAPAKDAECIAAKGHQKIAQGRISGIQIEGGYFNTLCTLSPFHTKSTQGKPIHISIIYGKNGSGKTSLSQLKSASSGERVDQVLTKIHIDKNFELNMISLLEKVIQEPVLSNRERIIIHIIKKSPKSEKFLMQATNIFSDPNIDRYPLCLQVVDESYKNALVDSISKVFDTDEAMKHREGLTSIVLKNFQIDLRPFNKIDSSLCDKLQSYINKYNSVIDIIKKDISQKLNSIYFPLTSRSYDLCNLQLDINQCIDNLEKSRVIYNKNIDSIADIKTNLIKINKNYAREEVRHFYQQYQHQLSECKSKEMQISAKEAELKELQVSINRLNAQKENINIAIELINDYLMYIFLKNSVYN